MLKRDGDVTLKIKTVQSDGNVLLYLARMEGGALVADLELPDDTGRSPEENAKLAASLVSQLKADPSPIQPGTPDYVEWEDALTRLVEERDEATRSDAQGMVEAQDMMNRGILRKLHGEGKTPEEAYAILWPAGEGGGTDPTPPEPGPADGTLFDDYVEKVTRALEAQGMTTSDAQGVVGAAMDRIRQLFADGVGPTSAARGLGDVVQPAATAPAEAEFLRKVKAGAMDALPLGELFGQIEAAVQKLADAGLLTGEVETDANEALTHWVELDEKANG